MLRFVILAVLVATAFVFLRLVLLSLIGRTPRSRPPESAPTIEARPRFTRPMTMRRFQFKHFAAESGPADPENFKEPVTLHAAPEGTDDIGIYTLTVATPGALAQSIAQGQAYSFQRNLLLVPRYDRGLIERALHEHINEIIYLSGEDA